MYIPVSISTIARARIIKLYEFLKLFLPFKITVHTKPFPSREREAIIPNIVLSVRCELCTLLLVCVGKAVEELFTDCERCDIMAVDFLLKLKKNIY